MENDIRTCFSCTLGGFKQGKKKRDPGGKMEVTHSLGLWVEYYKLRTGKESCRSVIRSFAYSASLFNRSSNDESFLRLSRHDVTHATSLNMALTIFTSLCHSPPTTYPTVYLYLCLSVYIFTSKVLMSAYFFLHFSPFLPCFSLLSFAFPQMFSSFPLVSSFFLLCLNVSMSKS